MEKPLDGGSNLLTEQSDDKVPFSFQKAQDVAAFEEMIELSLIAHARLLLDEKEKQFSTSLKKIMINQKALELTEQQVTRLKQKLQEYLNKEGGQKNSRDTKGKPSAKDTNPIITQYQSLNNKLEKIEKYRIAWAK